MDDFCLFFVCHAFICLIALIAPSVISALLCKASSYASRKLRNLSNFSCNLNKNKGQLLRIKNGVVWWNEGACFDTNEKICFLVDFCHKSDAKERKEKIGLVETYGSVINSQAALDIGGDYCLQIMINGKIIWVDAKENGVEFL